MKRLSTGNMSGPPLGTVAIQAIVPSVQPLDQSGEFYVGRFGEFTVGRDKREPVAAVLMIEKGTT
jgi:hypothetical protein